MQRGNRLQRHSIIQKQSTVPLMSKLKLKIWQKIKSPKDKAKFNKAVKQLKDLISSEKNRAIEEYLTNLTPTVNTDYSLWKAMRKIKNPQRSISPIRLSNGKWARSNKEKIKVLADHLTKIFEPFPQEIPNQQESEIYDFLDAPLQMELPIAKITLKEVEKIIYKELNVKKALGSDLINDKLLKEQLKLQDY